MLDRCQSYPNIKNWKVIKKVLHYLQGTKDYMFTYKRTNNLEIIVHSDFDYAGYKISEGLHVAIFLHYLLES